MARNVQLVRLLKLVQILSSSRRGYALKTLADRHQWPIRTLYRDMAALGECGLTVLEENGLYRMPSNSLHPPSDQLQADERLALFTMRQLAVGLRETTTGRALDKLWKRLSGEDSSSPLLLPKDSPPKVGVPSLLSIDYSLHRRNIATIEEALSESRPLTAQYEALSTGETTTRVIEPGELHWDPKLETLYLIAWCRTREAVRIFAVHRFHLLSLRNERFKPRAECSSQAALKAAFRVWRSASLEEVSLRLSGWAAREAKERKVHPSQRVRLLPGNEVRVMLQVAGLEEVKRWILSIGPLAVVEAPLRLIQAVQDDVARIAAQYPRVAARGRLQKNRLTPGDTRESQARLKG